jgi:SOS-response transcriptional repressor LexA
MPLHQTDGQRLACLRDYYSTERTLPSYQRLAGLLGYASTSAAAAAVKRLIAHEYLRRGEGGRICPGLRFFDRPIGLGRVPAGPPADNDEIGVGGVNIDSYLVRTPSRTFVVQLKGDSMIEAGLLDGDFVIAERNSYCRPGSIVVALIDGQVTVKYLCQNGLDVFLRPANIAYQDIKPKEQLQLVGLVVGSYRKLI